VGVFFGLNVGIGGRVGFGGIGIQIVNQCVFIHFWVGCDANMGEEEINNINKKEKTARSQFVFIKFILTLRFAQCRHF